MKSFIIPLIAVLILGAIAYTSIRPRTVVVDTAPTPSPIIAEISPVPSSATTATFDIEGSNYSFDVKEMRVKKGDQVTVNFTNAEGTHDFKIDEFNVATAQIPAGQSESVTFTADQAGTFEYYCSVGQHRQNGMVGSLIVE